MSRSLHPAQRHGHGAGGRAGRASRLPRRPWLVCGAAVAATFLLANWRLLLGRASGIWDAASIFFPYFVQVADFARAGRLVLWDPWSNAGTSNLGDPQVGAVSPLIWFPERVARLPASDAPFEAFLRRVDELGAAPLVVHDRENLRRRPEPTGADGSVAARALASLPPARAIPARAARYDPDELVLRLEAPADGWVLVTDRWAPGWRAWVDGHAVALRGGNFLFRALPVSRGLRFAYRPAGFPWLVALSWGTLALVAAGAVVAATSCSGSRRR